MLARSAAAASEAVADAAANEHLAAGGGALDAVLAGVFAAGGQEPGVLLGPISILIAGIGQGARAFDGRVRQPGLGAKRPRGFVRDEPIPEAARVGAPSALSAVFVAHAYGRSSVRSIVGPGIAAAERANAPERALFLERLAQVGAAAVSEAAYRRALLKVASASERGQLTLRDIDPPLDLDLAASEQTVDALRWIAAPWASQHPQDPGGQGRGAGVAAIDVHGLLAAALYRVPERGVWVEELGLLAPLYAIPVERGVPRVSPGTRLACGAPAIVRWDDSRNIVELAIEPESSLLDFQNPTSRRWTLRRDCSTRLVECRAS